MQYGQHLLLAVAEERLAGSIAEAGRVTVVYVFANGNADVASYWVEAPNKNVIRYAGEFKKAGSWETGTYDLRFTHASMSGVSSTKRGGTSMTKADLLGIR